MSDVGKSLLKGAEEALAFAKGSKSKAKVHKVNIPEKVDVAAIRKNLEMTRKEFSEVFAIRLRTLEKWERGERIPEGPTRAYLIVIAKHPNAVKDALES